MALTKMVDGQTIDCTPEEEAEILAQWAANEEKAKPTEYIRQRVPAYGSIGDQLDMMYWDKVNGTNKWQEFIAGIKAKYPKPS
jgi:hypothetical protein